MLSGADHSLSASLSIQSGARSISGSPTARPPPGSPPVTLTAVARPPFTKYNVSRLDGEIAAVRDVAAAFERGRMRLLENHVADAEQRGHHGDAEPEPAREHRRADRTRRQRSQREPQDHDVITRPLFIAR